MIFVDIPGRYLPFHNQPLSRSTRGLLQILFFLAIVVRCFFVYQTPYYIDQEPAKIRPFNDEYAHLKYSLYLKDHHSFPVNPRILPLSHPVVWIFNEFEYAQPPLFYLANLPFVYYSDPMLASRLFSVLLSALTLWIAVLAAVRIFRNKDAAIITFMALLGFHPVLVRIGSSVSNDNFVWLLSMVLFYLLLLDQDLKKKWLWGLVIGLGVLTKISFIIWILFLFLRWFFIKRESLILRRVIWIAFIALSLCAWWLIRNHSLYGDWSGIVGGSGPPGNYLAGGSIYAIKDFVLSCIRFSFFPVAEEPAQYLWMAEGILLLWMLTVFIQYKQIKTEFESASVFQQMMLFNALNLALFLYANLHWNFSETRLLLSGLLPITSIFSSAALINFRKAAPFSVIPIIGMYLVSLW